MKETNNRSQMYSRHGNMRRVLDKSLEGKRRSWGYETVWSRTIPVCWSYHHPGHFLQNLTPDLIASSLGCNGLPSGKRSLLGDVGLVDNALVTIGGYYSQLTGMMARRGQSKLNKSLTRDDNLLFCLPYLPRSRCGSYIDDRLEGFILDLSKLTKVSISKNRCFGGYEPRNIVSGRGPVQLILDPLRMVGCLVIDVPVELAEFGGCFQRDRNASDHMARLHL